jgi:UDP-glucose 4-epimerase
VQRILVTGATGFIGPHLVHRLVVEGHQVHILHRPQSDLSRLSDYGPALHFWQCDLLDAHRLQEVLESVCPQAIFHLAADTTLSLRHFDPALAGMAMSIESNIRSSINLFVCAANARLSQLTLLVRMGGVEEYGRGPLPCIESQREQPASPYSASQVAITHYLQMLSPRLHFRTVTVRPAAIYGPSRSTHLLIPSLIEHCLQGRDFRLGSRTHGRDFVYIDDFIGALVLLLTQPVPTGEIINIASGREHLIGDLASLVISLTGANIKLMDGAPSRAEQVLHMCASGAKAKKLLGWEPSTDLAEGLRRTITWFRKQAIP